MNFASLPPPRTERNLPLIVAAVAGIYAVLGGVVTMLGWAIPFPRLTDWADKGISMFPNAGVAAVACGAALLLLILCSPGRLARTTARALAILAALIGGATLAEHISGINIGIDELLFRGSWGQGASAAPMRIGLPASTSFLLLGMALLLSSHGSHARRVASALAVFPVAIASLSLTGYWFGSNQLYGIAKLTGISWQTASIVAALGVGVIAALPRRGFMALLCRDDAGGAVARRLLLPIIVVPLLLGWLRLLGQEAGLFDMAFGTAMRTLVEITFFIGFLWWTADSISRHAAAAKAAADALRTSEERFVRFMQSLPGLAWIKDIDGRYIYANGAAAAAFQCPMDRLLGRTDSDFLPPETAARFRENDLRALASATGVQVIETLLQADGIEHSSIVSKFSIPAPNGASPLVGGIAIDITDRMRAEEALKEAHRRKDEFLATLAHELRNPLAPMRYAVQFLRPKETVDPDLRQALDIIERQIQQMVRLLEDLLDVSRISYGKLLLRRERVQLAGIVRNAVEMSRPLLDAARQTLSTELPEGNITLDADPTRLAQALTNLLNNAAKFSRPGGRVTIKAERHGEEIILSVTDEGLGMAPETRSGIFQMFSQGRRSSQHPQGGLGIGLALVRGLVELHGGRVEAHSEGLDLGSEFRLYLPIAEPLPEEPAQAVVSETPLPAGPRYRILVADDLRDAADSIAVFLRAQGHEVRTAYDGEEALAVAANFLPDIALLDIGMPKLNGHEVCKRLRSRPESAGIFIVAITGWGQDSDRQLTSAAGFDRHLVKPVDVDTLLQLLAARASGVEGLRPA